MCDAVCSVQCAVCSVQCASIRITTPISLLLPAAPQIQHQLTVTKLCRIYLHCISTLTVYTDCKNFGASGSPAASFFLTAYVRAYPCPQIYNFHLPITIYVLYHFQWRCIQEQGLFSAQCFFYHFPPRRSWSRLGWEQGSYKRSCALRHLLLQLHALL